MKTNIIQIGNSQGVRIPKPILEQCHLEGEVELEVRGQELILHALRVPRQNWEESFKAMAQLKEDILEDNDFSNEWEEKEWKW